MSFASSSSSSTWATVGLGASVLAAIIAAAVYRSCPDQRSFEPFLREWLTTQIALRYRRSGTWCSIAIVSRRAHSFTRKQMIR